MEIMLITDDMPPEYPSPVEVGETVFVSGTLCNTNTSGGTTILEHSGATCVVTKSFWDYETGWRFHGRVVDEANVQSFREQSTTRFTPEYYKEKYPTSPSLYEDAKKASEAFDPGYVYFSEHDLAPKPAAANSPGPR